MSGAKPNTLSQVFLTMKITDSMQCDIWYQALLERAVEFTGVFSSAQKTTGVFCISVCRARKPRRENVEFIMTLNPRWMPASGHAKSVARRRMPGRPRLC